MTTTRRPLKFESADGGTSYVWPRYGLEYDNSQPLLAPRVALTGAHYEYDLLEGAPAIKGIGEHTLRFMLVGDPGDLEDELDEMKSKLFEIGRGKFFLEDSDGGQRWCWARVKAMPDVRLGVSDRNKVPVIVSWDQSSDFYGSEPDEHDVTEFMLISDPDTIEVTNPGNAPVYNAVVTLKGPFANPVITNETSGYVLQSTRDGAAASDWLRFDAGANTVEFSDDSGATWEDDSDNFVRADGQVALMVIKAGANEITVEGADTGAIVLEFKGAWH